MAWALEIKAKLKISPVAKKIIFLEDFLFFVFQSTNKIFNKSYYFTTKKPGLEARV